MSTIAAVAPGLTSAAASFSTSPLWYTTRACGIVAFVLFTLTTVLGLVATQRQLATRSWPRFATQALHRNASLLGLGFLLVHIATTILDGYVNVSWWSAVVPFVSPYQPFRVGLGTLAFDTVLLLVASSLIRSRLPEKVWRGIHWAAYAFWPISFVHFITEGTDGKVETLQWGFWLATAAAVVVGAAAVARWTLGQNTPVGPVRSVATR